MHTNEDSLPANFADKVLELESQLDDSLSMSIITELNELYRVILYWGRSRSIIMSDFNRERPSTFREKWQDY